MRTAALWWHIGLCLVFSIHLSDGLAIYPATQPCRHPPLQSSSACDPSIPIERRLDSLIEQLQQHATVPERAALLQNAAGAVDALSMPPYQWWNEALHGGVHVAVTAVSGSSGSGTDVESAVRESTIHSVDHHFERASSPD